VNERERRGYTAKNAQFWEDRGRSAPDDLSATLIAEHARFSAYIHGRELALLDRLVGDSRPRALDVGCGTGRLALALAPRCCEVVGIDVAQSLVERARASAAAAGITNVTFERRGADQPFAFGEFDLVLLSGVLNCLEDDDARNALAACVASLAPGGTLYIRNNCGVGKRQYRPGTADQPPTIHRTQAEYVEMVQRTGLTVVEEHYLFPPLCVPNLVYYHALPKRVRDTDVIGRVLDVWFAAEAATADVRTRWFAPLYAPMMRAIGKTTALSVIVARR
jgi:SAM-dependent methyltransferase